MELTQEKLRNILIKEGPYCRQLIGQNEEYLNSVLSEIDQTVTARQFYEKIKCVVKDLEDYRGFSEILRKTRQRSFMLIYAQEIMRIKPIALLTDEIAAFAEGVLKASLEWCIENNDFFNNLGVTEKEVIDSLVIFGMGKLGGRELNYSSDIDLIIVFETPEKIRSEEMELNYTAALTHLIREVVRSLEEHTEAGFVFRVDLRLRPFGSQGPIVIKGSDFIRYYRTWGRAWERAALLKARPVAGNIEYGNKLLTQLESFIFRKYLDYESIDEIKNIKKQIDAQANSESLLAGAPPQETEQKHVISRRERLRQHRRGLELPKKKDKRVEAPRALELLGWNIKTGIGGIREIEFFIQALQLVHSGKQPELRQRNTLAALTNLRAFGYITAQQHSRLSDAYDLFRRVEHRVQMFANQQKHNIPNDLELFSDFAYRLHFDSAEAFHSRLLTLRNEVHEIFNDLLEEAKAQSEEEATVARPKRQEDLIAIILSSDYLADEQLSALQHLGFKKPRQVAGQLHSMQQKINSPFYKHASAKDAKIGSNLIEYAANTPNPDAAFSHLTNFLSTVNHHAFLISTLSNNPHTTRSLLQLFGSTEKISRILINNPETFKDILSSRSFRPCVTWADLESELKDEIKRAQNRHHYINIFRNFFNHHLIRLALHFLGDTYPISVTAKQLSYLAELAIKYIYISTSEYYCKKNLKQDLKTANLLAENPLGIIAMGKLGGQEVTFSSDLDLVFVFDDSTELKREDYLKIAQRFLRNLSQFYYEVDPRLRPEGSQGIIVTSLTGFEKYQREQSEFWQRQALLRARPVLGSTKLRGELYRIVLENAKAREGEEPSVEIAAMRKKIGATFNPRGGEFHPKYSPGGIVDIEFWVQCEQLKLKRGGAYGELQPRGSRIMETPLSQSTEIALSYLNPDLREDYLELRNIEALTRLLEGNSDDDMVNGFVARHLGFHGDRYKEEYLEHRMRLLMRTREETELRNERN